MLSVKFTQTAVALSFLLLGATGCVTIIGGSDYYAHVTAPNRFGAQISYNGRHLGTENGIVSIKREDADKVTFTVKEEGCPEESFRFTTRAARGGTIAGNVVSGGLLGGLLFVGIDLATGAIWKPNVAEPGVAKVDYMHFRYTLPYNGCEGVPKVNDGLDAFYFNDGRMVRGTLVEQTAAGDLKVQLPNGNVETYKMRDLERMVRAEKK